MKTITELREVLPFRPHEINSAVKYFATCVNIDWDVYLPQKGMNLQRGFVWDITQKREIIWSILMMRNIPRMAMVNVIGADGEDIYQIIDGKQRLSSMIGFFNGEFTLEIDQKEYYYSDLPLSYQQVIAGYMFPYYIVNEDYDHKMPDDEKITWFKFINCAGTYQDKKHIKQLLDSREE